jgi:DNA-binding XRE family transcriptional regulator
MKRSTRKKLEAAGWKLGTVAEFLKLTKSDRVFVELKLALSSALQRRRADLALTQTQLAKLVGSSQPRVAFMESSEESVSIDLLVRTLFAMGATLKDLADVIRSAGRRSAA